MLLFRVLLLILGCWILASEGRRRVKGRTSNAADTGEGVPPLSLFIPPMQLLDVITSNITKLNMTEARIHLILEPLLAMLNEEEVQLLASIFPNLFPHGTVPEFSEKDQIIGRRSTDNETSTFSPNMFLTTPWPSPDFKMFADKSSENGDPLLMWLLKGKNQTAFPITTPSIRTIEEPSIPPLVGVTDDMLIIMLQRLMENVTTAEISTTTVPPELPGPVAIGDDLLSMLLKTLHTQAQETTTPAFDDSIIFNLTRSITTSTAPTTTEGHFFTTDEPFFTTTEKSIWPERVKPGGGISDEAIMQIIKDVENFTKNGTTETSDTTSRASEMNADAVAQIIHDVKALQATTSELNYLLSTTDGRELDLPETPKNKTKSSNDKKKKATKGGKNQTSKSKNTGAKRTNSTRKQKRQRLRTTTRRPSLWERIVRAAANAFFGDSQSKPGLFQAEDIIDLISSL